MKQKDKNQLMLNLNTPRPGPTTINTAVGSNAMASSTADANNTIVGSRPPIKIQGRLNWLMRWNKSADRFVQVDCERLVHLIARKTPIKIAILLACASVSGQVTKADIAAFMAQDSDPASVEREHVRIAHIVYDALDSHALTKGKHCNQAKTVELKDWDAETDHDGSNEMGFRIYCEDWGHVGDYHSAICAIKPVVLWFGK